jgi:hypothetical protein
MLFFGMQNKKILSAKYRLLSPYGASFGTFWHNFCRLMRQFLPYIGASFAALWPSTKQDRFWTGFMTAAYHQYLPAYHPHLFLAILLSNVLKTKEGIRK